MNKTQSAENAEQQSPQHVAVQKPIESIIYE